MFAGSFVKGLGCHVKAVRPGDGATLRVDANLREEGGVGEGLRDTSPDFIYETDVTDDPVIESEAQAVIADNLGADDVDELVHRAILPQGRDRLEGFFIDDALPVRQQLLSVQLGPVLDETKCPSR
jgi:hypothetical protein